MKKIKIKCHVVKRKDMRKCPKCGELYEFRDSNPHIDYHDDTLEVSTAHFCPHCMTGWYEIFYYSTTFENCELVEMI